MLVLSRKINETIKIGSNIEIRVIGIGSTNVRLGITAPEDVHIVRDNAKCQCPDPAKCGSNCCGKLIHG